ncbi:hypothetical protein [Gimesia chilikensis]|uniref:Uncharacterized protein n=1 Tax=Gimesia chilikensis TaxID=2605989 RepID=A0A517PH08_9PLAN|nr:hypothetical protein [Gimesia chilikensis]QDT18655.1 hypothetical protein HG66A1_04170 [Gimesia chilikensis]
MAEELLAFKRATNVTYLLFCLGDDILHVCYVDESAHDRIIKAIRSEDSFDGSFLDQAEIIAMELLNCDSEVERMIAKAEPNQKEKEFCDVGELFQRIADDFCEEFAQTLCLTSLLTHKAEEKNLEGYLSYKLYVRYFINLFLQCMSELAQADASILSITSLNRNHIQNIADAIPDYVRTIGKAYGVSTEYVAAIEAKCEQQQEQIHQLWNRYNKLAEELNVR